MQQQSGTQVRRVGFLGWIGRLKWIMVTISLVGLLASNIAAVLSRSRAVPTRAKQQLWRATGRVAVTLTHQTYPLWRTPR